jgi:hypothetical protein
MKFKKFDLLYFLIPIIIILISFFINYYNFYYNFPYAKDETTSLDTFSEIRARNIIRNISFPREIDTLGNEITKEYIITEIKNIYKNNVKN